MCACDSQGTFSQYMLVYGVVKLLRLNIPRQALEVTFLPSTKAERQREGHIVLPLNKLLPELEGGAQDLPLNKLFHST